jgi:hypothetical protein
MIWLASYPRSGNTYFRIVLHEVYGIESSDYHQEKNIKLNRNYQSYPVVKTHMLPSHLNQSEKKFPAIYLVRDGRDTLVSLAHHKKDFYDKNTTFIDNLHEIILAAKDSYFGGWSKHITEWSIHAKNIIHFENLIYNPIQEVEKIRHLIDLPKPQKVAPSFKDIRTKRYKYGRNWKKNRERFFRRGIVGAWKDEMPDDLHHLFWELHGDAMIKLGYTDGLFEIIGDNKRINAPPKNGI